MFELFGIPPQALFGQLMLGVINGAFYAMMSLGLALIFGVLNIINFTHGAQYMMGAFFSWLMLQYAGMNYWTALIVAPVLVGIVGAVFERLLLRHLYDLDHLYGFLLTFGVALLIEGFFRHHYGVSGQPYQIPDALTGAFNLGFMFLPRYRVWVVFASLTVCLGTWWLVERTQLGAYLRAATENPTLVRAFGVNVPRMITLTYVLGAALAAFAGVLAAPIYQVSSIMGSIVTGFIAGILEGLTKVVYPEASNTVVFIVMVVILLVRPQGLFGKRNY